MIYGVIKPKDLDEHGDIKFSYFSENDESRRLSLTPSDYTKVQRSLDIFDALIKFTPAGSKFLSLAPDTKSVEDECSHKDHHIRFTMNSTQRSSSLSVESSLLKNLSNALLTHPLIRGLLTHYRINTSEEDSSVESDYGETIPQISQVSSTKLLFIIYYCQQNTSILFVSLYYNTNRQ
jgi:hypothetical protein